VVACVEGGGHLSDPGLLLRAVGEQQVHRRLARRGQRVGGRRLALGRTGRGLRAAASPRSHAPVSASSNGRSSARADVAPGRRTGHEASTWAHRWAADAYVMCYLVPFVPATLGPIVPPPMEACRYKARSPLQPMPVLHVGIAVTTKC
jgi:hypothetical protein